MLDLYCVPEICWPRLDFSLRTFKLWSDDKRYKKTSVEVLNRNGLQFHLESEVVSGLPWTATRCIVKPSQTITSPAPYGTHKRARQSRRNSERCAAGPVSPHVHYLVVVASHYHLILRRPWMLPARIVTDRNRFCKWRAKKLTATSGSLKIIPLFWNRLCHKRSAQWFTQMS